MAAIHSTNTIPEVTLRKALWRRGLRFRAQYGKKKIDIAFPARKVAVFVDGCFWHGCPVHSHKVGTNEAYWQTKLEKNSERDKIKTAQLKAEGWVVLRFWEHELIDVDAVADQIQENLLNAGLKPIVPKKKSMVKSPLLSTSEKMEIEESEKEFATQNTKVYDNSSDLLNALHAEKEKAQTAKRAK